MKAQLARLAAGIAALSLCACGTSTTLAPTATAPPSATATAPVVAAFTAAPLPSATPAASSAPVSSLTGAPTAQPGPVSRRLTNGGCCVQPYWSADSSQVRYIDRPSSGQPSGIWAVNLAGGPPSFVTARLGIYSPDETLVAYPESGLTYIERVGGDRWKVDNGGRAVIFSPDSALIAWQAASSSVNFDNRQVQIWVAAADGSGARKVADLAGGGLAGWFPDARRLLVTSREGALSDIQALRTEDGSLALIAKGARIQGATLSPLGGWVAYGITFSGDASLDGLWVAPAAGGPTRRLEAFGGFAWRGEGRLLVIPLDANAASNRLIEFAADRGTERALTDPATTPFHIAGGNWALSPDGLHLAFVPADDHNIWVMDLPE